MTRCLLFSAPLCCAAGCCRLYLGGRMCSGRMCSQIKGHQTALQRQKLTLAALEAALLSTLRGLMLTTLKQRGCDNDSSMGGARCDVT